MDLKNKTILLTGATGGIGEAFVQEFAKDGAKFILVAKNQEELNQLVTKISLKDVSIYETDFSDIGKTTNLALQIAKNHPQIDILMNNAGIGVYDNLENIDPKSWFDSFAVNVHAPFIFSKILLANLQKSSTPMIINTGSQCGFKIEETRLAYNSTKFALRGMSLTMAQEFRDKGIKVVLLSFSSVMTNFGPLDIPDKKRLEQNGHKYFRPEYVAKEIVSRIKQDHIEDEMCLIQE
ncbi:SDR family oxidoreductase [candidate division WWE3 bacterium]|nr:SDR family oxidoreductase [candidate division WWE3 bacterium]